MASSRAPATKAPSKAQAMRPDVWATYHHIAESTWAREPGGSPPANSTTRISMAVALGPPAQIREELDGRTNESATTTAYATHGVAVRPQLPTTAR